MTERNYILEAMSDEEIVEKVREKLEGLAILQAEYDVQVQPFQEKLSQIEAEMRVASAEIREQITRITEEIKAATFLSQHSVKGKWYQAIYRKGATRWDGKELTHLAGLYPDILKCKKEGKPSVTIQQVKKEIEG